MFKSFRSIFLILQLLLFINPLFRQLRRKNFPLLLKEGMFLALANWDIISQYLKNRNFSFEKMKKYMQFKKFRK